MKFHKDQAAESTLFRISRAEIERVSQIVWVYKVLAQKEYKSSHYCTILYTYKIKHIGMCFKKCCHHT